MTTIQFLCHSFSSFIILTIGLGSIRLIAFPLYRNSKMPLVLPCIVPLIYNLAFSIDELSKVASCIFKSYASILAIPFDTKVAFSAFPLIAKPLREPASKVRFLQLSFNSPFRQLLILRSNS